MKWLLWMLLLANLVFFATMQWGESVLGIGKVLPNQPPLNAEKIKLLAASAVIPMPVTLASAVAPASHAQAASTVTCLEWGEFSGTDLERSATALSALNLGSKSGQRQVEYASGYWAYIPPSKSRAEADRKVAVLKKRGVDNFIVQDAGKWHNAISLGVFKTIEAAQKFLDSLAAKGIKTALIGERKSKLKFTVFVLKELDAPTSIKIKALQSEFPGSELKELPCSSVLPQLTSGG